jgi:acylpyruvate hydrolase
MRLATVRQADGSTRAARVDGDALTLLGESDVGAVLATGAGWQARAAAATGATVALAGADLATLVTRPPKVWCVGLNYANHINETGSKTPDHPTLFAKYAIALTGPNDPIAVRPTSDRVDWEVELGVVIGTAGRDVPVADALDHVAGYTVVNDVSMRDWQRRTQQFLQGKTWERATPVGPWLVTPDELPAGGRGLRVRTMVDDQVMQDDTTEQLLFDVAHLVSYVSAIASLEPGDLIATGTPAGVGAARTPPVFLKPGQTLRTSIEGIGELVNPIVAA